MWLSVSLSQITGPLALRIERSIIGRILRFPLWRKSPEVRKIVSVKDRPFLNNFGRPLFTKRFPVHPCIARRYGSVFCSGKKAIGPDQVFTIGISLRLAMRLAKASPRR